MAGLKCEYLGQGVSVFCSDTHRFGTDAVLLHHFALGLEQNKARRAKRIMDMGCGCGIIPMLFARDAAGAEIYAVDIQEEAILLVKRSAEYCKMPNVHPILCDINELIDKYPELKGSFDLITMNPPYKRAGSGLMSENEGLNIARFELKCNFDDICKTAAKMIKPGGRFCVCNRPNRLADMICAMRKYKIEPKRMMNVCNRASDAPMLVLVEGVMSGNADMTVCPQFVLEDEHGKITQNALKMYEKWDYERKTQGE